MSTILIDCEGYKLTSYCDESIYVLEHADRYVVIQGEDANQLREEIATFELAWPCASRGTLGRYLWMTLEYGLASAPLETV